MKPDQDPDVEGLIYGVAILVFLATIVVLNIFYGSTITRAVSVAIVIAVLTRVFR